MTNQKIKVIGISGASNAGKTTISKRLAEINKGEFLFICMDDFYYPPESPKAIKIEDMPIPNFDCMQAIDWESLNQDFKKKLLLAPKTVKYLIVEGIFVLNYEPIASRMDLKIFLTLDKQTMYERRLERKYQIPEPANYFERFVYPAYLKVSSQIELEKESIHIFSGTMDKEKIFKTVYDLIVEKGADEKSKS